MHSRVWGKYVWKMLHTYSYLYPDAPSNEMKEMTKKFILDVQKILPCPVCRNHFKTKINSSGFKFIAGKKKFVNWLIEAHNEVNKGLAKPNYSKEWSDRYYTDLIVNKKNEILLNIVLLTNLLSQLNTPFLQFRRVFRYVIVFFPEGKFQQLEPEVNILINKTTNLYEIQRLCNVLNQKYNQVVRGIKMPKNTMKTANGNLLKTASGSVLQFKSPSLIPKPKGKGCNCSGKPKPQVKEDISYASLWVQKFKQKID